MEELLAPVRKACSQVSEAAFNRPEQIDVGVFEEERSPTVMTLGDGVGESGVSFLDAQKIIHIHTSWNCGLDRKQNLDKRTSHDRTAIALRES